MIRPFTCICFLLACGSGLYLYQAKHRVQMLDHEIGKTVHETETVREQTRVLHAEWTLLNDPQRLQLLADQFLTLKPVTPGQFTSMAELDNRLPPVPPPEPPAAPSVPVAEAPPPVPSPEPPVAEAAAPPAVKSEARTEPPPSRPEAVAQHAPPAPPAKPNPVVAAAPPAQHVPDHKPPPPRPVVADATPPVRAAAPAHAVVTAELRRQPSRVVPAAIPVVAPTVVASGSLLGMARNAPPPPKPMPYVFSPVLTAGGGG